MYVSALEARLCKYMDTSYVRMICPYLPAMNALGECLVVWPHHTSQNLPYVSVYGTWENLPYVSDYGTRGSNNGPTVLLET